jgi:hypothetical protein
MPMGGSAKRITAGAGGTAWVVNRAGEIFQWQDGAFRRMPGSAVDIGSNADGQVWIVGTAPRGISETGAATTDKTGANQSPSICPTGWSGSTRSQMTLMTIIIGTASRMPQTPHTQLQNSSPTKTADLIHRRGAADEQRRQKKTFESRDEEGYAGDERGHADRLELQIAHNREAGGDQQWSVVRNRIEDAGQQSPERGLLQADRPQSAPRHQCDSDAGHDLNLHEMLDLGRDVVEQPSVTFFCDSGPTMSEGACA